MTNILILFEQNEIDWTKNKSTSWDSLQSGDPFVMAGLLANVFVHSQFWRDLFITSRPQSLPASAPSIAQMQLWFSVQSVPRKWAEKLVNIHHINSNVLIIFCRFCRFTHEHVTT
jgi:hypothetical protein